jgi:hypothetical protein
MPLAPPANVNYPSSVYAMPCGNQDIPVEGPLQVWAEVLWGTMGGAGKAVSFNLQNQQVLNFSQISTLAIDNSLCTVPISFYFPDNDELLTIAANVKRAIVPVFSNALQFVLAAPTSLSTDITRFRAINFPIAPLIIL